MLVLLQRSEKYFCFFALVDLGFFLKNDFTHDWSPKGLRVMSGLERCVLVIETRKYIFQDPYALRKCFFEYTENTPVARLSGTKV